MQKIREITFDKKNQSTKKCNFDGTTYCLLHRLKSTFFEIFSSLCWPLQGLRSKKFQKTLILAFEANSALSYKITFFLRFSSPWIGRHDDFVVLPFSFWQFYCTSAKFWSNRHDELWQPAYCFPNKILLCFYAIICTFLPD